MKCLYCGCNDSKVIDSRAIDESNSIRRRRECLCCGKRFTTYETFENTPLLVVKRNGERQLFDSKKIKNGIIRACEKRPVSAQQIEKMLTDIEMQVQNNLDQEVTTTYIGELVMNELKKVDDVAYVRFASVYKQFKDISNFSEFLTEYNSTKKDKK